MKIKVIETHINNFKFEIIDNSGLSEEEKVKNGSLSLNFPYVDTSDEEDSMPLEVSMSIELIEDDFSISAEIIGTFMIPRNVIEKEFSKNILDASNEILKPLVDKFSIYFGFFSSEARDVMSLPRLKIKFSDVS